MNTKVAASPTHKEWKELYKGALFEADSDKVSERIALAEWAVWYRAGASMSECDERPKDEKSWKKLYEAALLEFDPHLLPQRIAEAQEAIGERALALRANGEGNSEEEALQDAHFALGDLKRMRPDRHDV